MGSVRNRAVTGGPEPREAAGVTRTRLSQRVDRGSGNASPEGRDLTEGVL